MVGQFDIIPSWCLIFVIKANSARNFVVKSMLYALFLIPGLRSRVL